MEKVSILKWYRNTKTINQLDLQKVARLIVSCEYEDGIEPLRSVALVHTLSRNDDGSVNLFSPSDATRAAALLPVADGEPQGSARQRLFCFILLKLNMTQVLQSGSENRPLIHVMPATP